MTFLEDLEQGISGVAYKNNILKKEIVAILATSGNHTIPELRKKLNLSIPKTTSLVNELMEEELVADFGKSSSATGRRPNIYGLIPSSGFFMGVDVKQDHINIGLVDLMGNMVCVSEQNPYQLSNEKDSLDSLCNSIRNFIKKAHAPKEKILGMGVNLSGRINYTTGYSYSFFHFSEEPLSAYLERTLGIKTFIENDSRAMAYGEFVAGVVGKEKNVLFLNLDYGTGMGTLINGQLYYGKSGFAGEFGHIPIFDNDIICQCGKKGCLETEASGWALKRLFLQKIKEGHTSLVTKAVKEEDIRLEHIIQAAKDDDVLAIELIAQIAEKLGRGVALLINLYNPDLIILGGVLAETSQYILFPLKSAINKYSLNLVNSDTQIKISSLGEKSGVLGACLLVRDRFLSKLETT